MFKERHLNYLEETIDVKNSVSKWRVGDYVNLIPNNIGGPIPMIGGILSGMKAGKEPGHQ